MTRTLLLAVCLSLGAAVSAFAQDAPPPILDEPLAEPPITPLPLPEGSAPGDALPQTPFLPQRGRDCEHEQPAIS